MLSEKLEKVFEAVSDEKYQYTYTKADEGAVELAAHMIGKITDKFQLDGADRLDAVVFALCQLSKFVLQNWDKFEGGNEGNGSDD